jgi:hypothetical protein
MISYEKELRVNHLLDEGIPMRVIERDEGVPYATIHGIKQAREINSSVPPNVRSEICSLILSGLSVEAVAKRVNASREAVVAVRRVNFLQVRRVNYPQQCPTCGGAVLPPRNGSYEPTPAPRGISQSDAHELFRIADDIVGLAREYIVPNIIFYNIAKRSEAVIHSITGGTNVKKNANTAQ